MSAIRLVSMASLISFCKYSVVGGISTVCDLAVFSLLTVFLGANYLLATVIAVTIGTAVNFALCLRYVFVLQKRSKRQAWWYKLVFSFLSLLLNLILMYIFVDILALDKLTFVVDGIIVCRLISTGTVFLVNYSLSKYVVFKDF